MFNNKRDLNYTYRNLKSHLKFWKIYNLRNKQKPVFFKSQDPKFGRNMKKYLEKRKIFVGYSEVSWNQVSARWEIRKFEFGLAGYNFFQSLYNSECPPINPNQWIVRDITGKFEKTPKNFKIFTRKTESGSFFCFYLLDSNAGGRALWRLEAAKSVSYKTVLLDRLNIFSSSN